MDNIEFRGQRVDSGEWIESHDILRREDWDGKTGWTTRYFLQDGYSCNQTPCLENFFEVISETVGQYTTIDDIDSDNIFKGDIIQLQVGETNKKLKRHILHSKKYVIEWHFGEWIGIDLEHRENMPLTCLQCGKIIGNRIDNPELLEIS